MSKVKRTLADIHFKPHKNDIRLADVESLLISKKYIKLQGEGSRVKYFNKALDSLISIHIPHPKPELNADTVKLISRTLKEVGIE